MRDIKKWRVTGPEGVNVIVEATEAHAALIRTYHVANEIKSLAQVMYVAGYRAEPIEEPKMVTVRAEDVGTAIVAAEHAHPAGLLPHEVDSLRRLRAALDGAK